ncbi:hypothetical protein BGZ83_010594 [Gryganskiella cystojenkinii]|nr:hypothetical protein BGZ83_010594 [Gryganskiella cystojenkinii]
MTYIVSSNNCRRVCWDRSEDPRTEKKRLRRTRNLSVTRNVIVKKEGLEGLGYEGKKTIEEVACESKKLAEYKTEKNPSSWQLKMKSSLSFTNILSLAAIVAVALLVQVQGLHCWKDRPTCRSDPKNPSANLISKHASHCDTPKNRIKDLRPFKDCILKSDFCAPAKNFEFHVRPRDGNTTLPSAAVCKNKHSKNAVNSGDQLASCVTARLKKQGDRDLLISSRNTEILCCEAKINKGCL